MKAFKDGTYRYWNQWVGRSKKDNIIYTELSTNKVFNIKCLSNAGLLKKEEVYDGRKYSQTR